MTEVWKDVSGYEGLYQISTLGRIRSLYRNKVSILHPRVNKHGYLTINLYRNKKRKTYLIHRLVANTFIPLPPDSNKDSLEVDHINTNRADNRLENLRWCTSKENCNNKLTIEHKSGVNAPMYGKQHTKETKKKISNTIKRRYAEGMVNPMYGKQHTDNTKKKISDTRREFALSAGEKNPMYGKNHSEKAKRKMSEVKLGGNNPHAKKVYCIELNKYWDTIEDCSKELGLYSSGISSVCCKRRKTCGKYHFEFA